jgi:hypothetical protein
LLSDTWPPAISIFIDDAGQAYRIPGRRRSRSSSTMRVKLKGVATKLLASGEKVTYYYAWRGGTQLGGQPDSPEFVQMQRYEKRSILAICLR